MNDSATTPIIPVCETPTPAEQEKILKDIERTKKAKQDELAVLSAPPKTKAEYEAQRRKLTNLEIAAKKSFDAEKTEAENGLEQRKREATRAVTNLVAEVRKFHVNFVERENQRAKDAIKAIERLLEKTLSDEHASYKTQLEGFEIAMNSEHMRLDAEHGAIMAPKVKYYEGQISEIREAQKTLDAAYAELSAKKNKSSSGALRDGLAISEEIPTMTPDLSDEDIPADSAAAPIKAKSAGTAAVLMEMALGGDKVVDPVRAIEEMALGHKII